MSALTTHLHRTVFLLAFLALAGIPVSGSAAAQLPAPAPTVPCPVHRATPASTSPTKLCDAEFSLPASNGYRITVSACCGGVHSYFLLTARRGPSAAAYFGRGVFSASGLKATFGHLGRVDVRFLPAGRARHPHQSESCHPGTTKLLTTRTGTFLGTIRFRGEHHFTTVKAHRAVGAFDYLLRGDGIEKGCKPPNRGGIVSFRAQRNQGKTGASAVFGVPVFSAQIRAPRVATISTATEGAAAPAPSRLAHFSAFVAERRERMLVIRSVSTSGPRRRFLFDDSLSSATLAPPPPFTGTGSFERRPDGSTAWTGTLSVPLPGRGMVSLAGPGFESVLNR